MTVTIEEPGSLERRLAGGIVRRFLYPRRPLSRHIPTSDAYLPRHRFTARDGARLVGLHHPAEDPVGIVVLVHPDKRTAKHWWTRQGIPRWLNHHGLDAFAFDLAVYGESRGGNVYLHDHVIAAVDEATRLRPGLPVHLWGVSLGAFAALNAAPELPQVEGLVAESPYTTFRDWYDETGHRSAARVVALLERLFPLTYARIDARRNLSGLDLPAVLIAATRTDRITPVALTRTLHEAAPPHVRYVEEEDAEHLRLFRHSATYREAVLDTFGVQDRPGRVPPLAATDTTLPPQGVAPLSPPTA